MPKKKVNEIFLFLVSSRSEGTMKLFPILGGTSQAYSEKELLVASGTTHGQNINVKER